MSLIRAVTLSCFFGFQTNLPLVNFTPWLHIFLREINLNLLDSTNAKYLIIFFELHSLCIMNKNCMRGKNAKFQRTNSFHDLLACGSGVTPLCINVHSTLRIVIIIIIKIYIKSVPVFLLGRHELPPFEKFEPKQCCCEE